MEPRFLPASQLIAFKGPLEVFVNSGSSLERAELPLNWRQWCDCFLHVYFSESVRQEEIVALCHLASPGHLGYKRYCHGALASGNGVQSLPVESQMEELLGFKNG
ncbi:hypothetical protein KOW79_021111 [Hemibagrus wyckioides]|uniref:Uncharacterized protein n=1 Tax=Hemibagrus wyckioides TaxID=337641 RepID=A0A9D3N291_9TELE|nr:hypothetical protein KOW79_021111 [Hemibagrus wyckioides]